MVLRHPANKCPRVIWLWVELLDNWVLSYFAIFMIIENDFGRKPHMNIVIEATQRIDFKIYKDPFAYAPIRNGWSYQLQNFFRCVFCLQFGNGDD